MNSQPSNTFRSPLLWTTFISYIIILWIVTTHHEWWGDEMHAWNIAKASTSFTDLIQNTRYEGHPPAWHILLWIASKLTLNIYYVKSVQFIIAIAVVYTVLFLSPFPLLSRILIPFGYYFLFEYGALSRNYAIAVLPAFLICYIMRKEFAGKWLLYYVLLFILTNTHLLALPLAAALHLYSLWWNREQQKKKSLIALHVLAGLIIALPALYFISPPSDSTLNMQHLVKQWKPDQVLLFAKAPAWAFMPVPAWWKYNFWNTQFLVSANDNVWMKIIAPVISAVILTSVWFVLKKSKKCLALFTVSFGLTAAIALTAFGLAATRYVGFIYISFLAAWWLYNEEQLTSLKHQRWINGILIIQLLAGVYASVQDIRLPFSNSYRVKELLQEVPVQEKTVMDYWALTTVSAYTNQPMYCVDIKKESSFISWGIDINKDPDRYYNGIRFFLEKEKRDSVYMISTAWPEKLLELGPTLECEYKVELFDKRDGAIDKGGNIYLYKISKR